MKTLGLFLLPLLLAVSASAASVRYLAGGWTPIKNLNDKHVIDIANFAVSEYNNNANSLAKLALSKVLKGETQVVAGINYKLVIETKSDKGVVRNYEVIVWEKEWEKFRQLTSFKPVKS
ncbi:uncharacterized protein A4U43_C08F10460 [Asparagus officinalis]|uniref:cysteine proteinase inhibitor 1-like n=1 Tax=Asparagus officinalis TaxID=4686 RepID=UPI00098E57CF|nr:cysteine proteinase inhibitor 1-like [Asparagus officinalis]ONK59770.1 uncharacterized protein A4U43_C08F10460 [Asparagus officinalis]